MILLMIAIIILTISPPIGGLWAPLPSGANDLADDSNANDSNDHDDDDTNDANNGDNDDNNDNNSKHDNYGSNDNNGIIGETENGND